MHILFGKKLYLFIFIVLSNAATASDLNDQGWLDSSKEIINSTKGKEYSWLTAIQNDQYKTDIEQIVNRSKDITVKKYQDIRKTVKKEIKEKILIFASFSVPNNTLINLLEESADQDVVMVFRGLPDSYKIKDAVKRLRDLASDNENPGSVVIDPTLFSRYQITQVPTLVYLRGENKKPVYVNGAVSKQWLVRQVDKINQGERYRQPVKTHLGTVAETYSIHERDLIEVMKERVSAINWEEKKSKAIDQFWKKEDIFINLETAKEDKEYFIDPTITVTEDIYDANDKLLIPAGQKYNPLDIVPITKSIFVFNGTDKKQSQLISKMIEKTRSQGRGVIVITTSVETENGWKSLDAIEHDMKAPVYLLQKDLADRLHLSKVPAVITGVGNKLLIKEYGI